MVKSRAKRRRHFSKPTRLIPVSLGGRAIGGPFVGFVIGFFGLSGWENAIFVVFDFGASSLENRMGLGSANEGC